MTLECVLERERHPRPRRAAQGLPRAARRRQATSSTCGEPSARASGCSAHPRHRRRRVHQRLSRPGAARGRPRGRRARRLLEVRAADEVVRRPSSLPLRRGRRQGRGAPARARGRLRPGRRVRGDDRRHQLLPRVRLRPDGRERADPRLDLRRRDRRPSRRPPVADHRASRRRWSTSRRPSSRHRKAPSAPRPRRSAPTASRSSRRSTSRRAPGSSTSLPYTIVRPFNCVGIGERRALRDTDIMSGNVKLALSHVVPGPGPQGAPGPGPAAHPRRRIAGPPLHVRRRPRPRHPPRDGVGRDGQ